MSVVALATSSVLGLCLMATGGLAQAPGAHQAETSPTPAVSILKLVSNCAAFENETVMITGFAMFEFENYKICPSSELARFDPTSCFWLRADKDGIPDDQLEKLKDSSGSFVTVEARVGCSKYLYAGYLDRIQLIVELKTGTVLWTTDPAMKAAMESQQEAPQDNSPP